MAGHHGPNNIRLSFPHPILVWSGHVESTGVVVIDRNYCCSESSESISSIFAKYVVTYFELIFVFSTKPYRFKLTVLIIPSMLQSVCVFSSRTFWTSSSLDVPAGVTQDEGHTGFFIHLLSAVRASVRLARRIQQFLFLIDREVKFCKATSYAVRKCYQKTAFLIWDQKSASYAISEKVFSNKTFSNKIF